MRRSNEEEEEGEGEEEEEEKEKAEKSKKKKSPNEIVSVELQSQINQGNPFKSEKLFYFMSFI